MKLPLRTAGCVGAGIQPAVTARATGPIYTVEETAAVVGVGGPDDIWITDGAGSLAGGADPVPHRVRGLALFLPQAQAVPRLPVADIVVACHLGLGDSESTADPAEDVGICGPAYRVGRASGGTDAAVSVGGTSHFILQLENGSRSASRLPGREGTWGSDCKTYADLHIHWVLVRISIALPPGEGTDIATLWSLTLLQIAVIVLVVQEHVEIRSVQVGSSRDIVLLFEGALG